MTAVSAGIDVWLQQPPPAKGRIGMVTNNVALDATGRLSRVALLQDGFPLVRLFSPEHGMLATGADGAHINNGTDAATGLTVVSLYGNKLAPSAGDLENVDTVLFDIPDAGTRCYTYLWTLTHVMESCARLGIPLVVLDRPNPLGLQLALAEGPMLDEDRCSSFIGRWRIPLRHSCTMGELARYFAATRLPGLALEVVPCQNLSRSWHALQQPEQFVPTSPAIRTAETAFLYAGTALTEGLNLSEGRGTPYPFSWFGAPWIEAATLHSALQALQLSGIEFNPLAQVPQEGPWAGQHCNGLRLNITDAGSWKPVTSVLAIIRTLMRLYPQQVGERLYPTAANPTGSGHLDKLLGVNNAFELLKQGAEIDTDVAQEWEEMVGNYLLYR